MGLFSRARPDPQQVWDGQIDDLRDGADRADRTARLLDAGGLRGAAAHQRAGAAEDRTIAERMQGCPRNPRNGGRGAAR